MEQKNLISKYALDRAAHDVLTYMAQAGLPHPTKPTVEHLQYRVQHLEGDVKDFMHSYTHLMHLIGVHGVERLDLQMPEIYAVAWAEVLTKLTGLLYNTIGTGAALGLDLISAWDEVHAAHMRKIVPVTCLVCKGEEEKQATCAACGGSGTVRSVTFDANGHVARPRSWTPPDIGAVIRRQLGLPK